MEKNNATREQVGLDGNNLLPPRLWWGHLVVSRLLKSTLAMKVKVCHFGSDTRFHKCYVFMKIWHTKIPVLLK